LFHCNSWTDKFAVGFSNPKTQSMVGIIVLYDFIMLFLIIILAVKLVFFVHSLWVAGSFVRTREYFLPFELAVQFHHNLRRKWFFYEVNESLVFRFFIR